MVMMMIIMMTMMIMTFICFCMTIQKGSYSGMHREAKKVEHLRKNTFDEYQQNINKQRLLMMNINQNQYYMNINDEYQRYIMVNI